MRPKLADQTLPELVAAGEYDCGCGRTHRAGLRYLKIGEGAVAWLPEALKTLGIRRPFVVCDANTAQAAMGAVCAALKGVGMNFLVFTYPGAHVEPDEHSVGSLCMAFDPACDGVLAVGSGVINDCCKVLAHALRLPQAVVATAPSMDGYASNSSSMIRDGVKTTLYNACPGAIIADTQILKNAPIHMLRAGLGDMLAKYVALCEWRISHIVTGEAYCAEVAALMRASLAKIVAAAPRLMARDPEAVGAVTDGLILSGLAMAYAEVSRPASGLEHYFSHLWEMFALERGAKSELHGIQVGVGTLLTLRLYDRLRAMTPDAPAAELAMRCFRPEGWAEDMRRVFGSTAQALIDQEQLHWQQNDPDRHAERLSRIIGHWPEIQAIMQEELPSALEIESLMREAGMPLRPEEIGIAPQDVRDALLHSRDIRDKYLTSSLLWDLGLLESFALML